LFLKGKAAAAIAVTACAAGAGAAVAAVACIPDLPGDQPADAAEAAPPGHCGDGITQLDLGEQCDPGPIPPGSSLGGCTSDCKVDCPGGYAWPANYHCYTRYPKTTGSLFGQALQYCRGVGGHVVTFASEEEFQEVVRELQLSQSNPPAFWVGLQPDPEGPNEYTPFAALEPGWSPTCSGCFVHSDDASAPLPGAPGCVQALADLDASWQQSPCTDAGKIHVICEREPPGALSDRCDAGVCFDLAWTFGTKHYVYVRPVATADQAEAHCASLGGTLVVLRSRDEREQLWHELQRMPVPTPDSVWIGLSSDDAGNWMWDDEAGVDAYPSPWGASKPNSVGTRARVSQLPLDQPPPLDNTLADNDINSQTTLSFVCQVPAGVEAGDAGDAGDAGEGGAIEAGEGGD
jgi:hypothetical protein